MTSRTSLTSPDVEFRGHALDYVLELAVFWVMMTVTFGLYLPWGVMRLSRWYNQNWYIHGTALKFDANGWEYALQLLLDWVLRVVTLGLYWPWGACRMQRWVDSQGSWNGKKFQFTGSGLGLLFLWLWWGPIMLLTLGLAFPFAQCSLQRWFSRNTRVGNLRMQFDGDAWEYAVLLFTHYLLCLVTLGLYFPFGAMREERWFARNMSMQPVQEGAFSSAPGLRPFLGVAAMSVAGYLVVSAGPVNTIAENAWQQTTARVRQVLPIPVTTEKKPVPSQEAAEPPAAQAAPAPALRTWTRVAQPVVPQAEPAEETPPPDGASPGKVRMWKSSRGEIHITNTQ